MCLARLVSRGWVRGLLWSTSVGMRQVGVNAIGEIGVTRSGIMRLGRRFACFPVTTDKGQARLVRFASHGSLLHGALRMVRCVSCIAHCAKAAAIQRQGPPTSPAGQPPLLCTRASTGRESSLAAPRQREEALELSDLLGAASSEAAQPSPTQPNPHQSRAVCRSAPEGPWTSVLPPLPSHRAHRDRRPSCSSNKERGKKFAKAQIPGRLRSSAHDEHGFVPSLRV